MICPVELYFNIGQINKTLIKIDKEIFLETLLETDFSCNQGAGSDFIQ